MDDHKQDYAEMMADAYPVLLGLMIRLVESVAGGNIKEGEDWRNNANILALKLFRHLVSMSTLSEGSMKSEPLLHHIDHSSINVIARAALETYLVWHYLFGPQSTEQSKFRCLTWQLGGLMDIQEYQPTSSFGFERQSEKQVQAESLKVEIRAFTQYQELTSKQQIKLLEGDWKIVMKTNDFAREAGFHGTYFKNIYSHLCGYSHASYISADQVACASDLSIQAEFARIILGVGVVIMAHFASSYPKQFPEAQAVLDADPEAKAVAETWAFLEEDMNSIYGASK